MQFLRNKNCYLRAVELYDAPELFVLENDESLWQVSGTQKPFSMQVIEDFIQSNNTDIYQNKQVRLIICSCKDNQFIGVIDLFDYHPKHHRAFVGIAIKPSFQRKGFATQALTMVSNYAHIYWDLHQLCADISVKNTNSIQLFEKCGFSFSALKKDWIFNQGTFEDVAFYQKFL